jgi:hypothetical protein
MTGRKSKSPGPKTSKAKAGTRHVRKTASAGKVDAPLSPRKSAARARSAAPLLARTEKKTGAVEKASRTAKPSARASYHPKTEPPSAPANVHAHGPVHAFDFLALAQPWMTLGWRMTATGLAMQARMTKAALDMPLATTAMRQGAEALNAWFALAQQRTTKPRKD